MADSAVVQEMLAGDNYALPLQECTFLGSKGYDVKAVYDLVKDAYQRDAVIPLNKRNTKFSEKLLAGTPLATGACARSFAVLSGSPNPA